MPRRQYRRRIHYPGLWAIRVTFETKEAVEEVADQAGWSMAETVRECIQVGLPTVKSRLNRDYDPASGAVDA